MSSVVAGPELNMAVADKIMGLLNVRMGVMRYWFNPATCGYRADDGLPSQEQDYAWPVYQAAEPSQHWTGGNGLKPVPDYSGEIADAWQVVEKLRDEGWLVSIKSMPAGKPFILTWMGGWAPGVYRHGGCVAADTAPLAICLAAMGTVEN